MKIAIASTDGINVDQHFGKATHFHIFEVTQEAFNLVTIRHLDETFSTGDKNHTFDEAKFAKVTACLLDCQKIFVTKVGEAPAKALKDLGVDPVEYKGLISQIDL